MFNNDYIMRMIEQLSRAIAKIVGLKDDDRMEEGQELLNTTLTGFIGLNSHTIDSLDYEEFLRILSANGGLNADKCVMLSELLKLKAEFYIAQGNEDGALDLYIKSLCLYLEALLDDGSLFAEPHTGRVGALIRTLEGNRMPPNALRLLARFYELSGQYGKAEDCLFELLEASQYQAGDVTEGFAFYDRLLQKDPVALEKGNLPLAEVTEGRARLSKHSSAESLTELAPKVTSL
jgi:tetratricopeptide (TPR) repeat protein